MAATSRAGQIQSKELETPSWFLMWAKDVETLDTIFCYFPRPSEGSLIACALVFVSTPTFKDFHVAGEIIQYLPCYD